LSYDVDGVNYVILEYDDTLQEITLWTEIEDSNSFYNSIKDK